MLQWRSCIHLPSWMPLDSNINLSVKAGPIGTSAVLLNTAALPSTTLKFLSLAAATSWQHCTTVVVAVGVLRLWAITAWWRGVAVEAQYMHFAAESHYCNG